jgi:four helix bundle protein
MDKNDLKNRTKNFALEIIKLSNLLPKNPESQVIRYQIIKAGTSVAANYRAACRARSKIEFAAKLGIVIEEADECSFWLELIIDIKLISQEIINPILKESNEITAIMVASCKSVKEHKF